MAVKEATQLDLRKIFAINISPLDKVFAEKRIELDLMVSPARHGVVGIVAIAAGQTIVAAGIGPLGVHVDCGSLGLVDVKVALEAVGIDNSHGPGISWRTRTGYAQMYVFCIDYLFQCDRDTFSYNVYAKTACIVRCNAV